MNDVSKIEEVFSEPLFPDRDNLFEGKVRKQMRVETITRRWVKRIAIMLSVFTFASFAEMSRRFLEDYSVFWRLEMASENVVFALAGIALGTLLIILLSLMLTK